MRQGLALELLSEPPPPRWGAQLRDCRKAAGLNIVDVEEILAPVFPTTDTTIGHLEQRHTPPTQHRQITLAVLLMVIYGFEPALIGFSLDDLPTPYQAEEVLRDLRFPSNRWTWSAA